MTRLEKLFLVLFIDVEVALMVSAVTAEKYVDILLLLSLVLAVTFIALPGHKNE